VAEQKAAGVRRVICMGDSCSAQGMPTYAGLLHELLQVTPPDGNTWEAFNTAVHGYSVLQGLHLFELRVRHFQPDIVTIFYGWNDHWLNETPDAQRLALTASPFARAMQNAIHRKRISALLQREQPESGAKIIRVPPADYERGLRDLIRDIRSAGAKPLVLTAPRAHTLTSLLVHNGQAVSVDEAIRLHDEYVELTRRVAEAEGASLLDLAATFAGSENAALFSRDGIHFENAGRRRIAELIHRELQSPGLR
jgi:lysophospholipase L1-like esterase